MILLHAPHYPFLSSPRVIHGDDVADDDGEAGVRNKHAAFLLQTFANESTVPTTIVPFSSAAFNLLQGFPVALHPGTSMPRPAVRTHPK